MKKTSLFGPVKAIPYTDLAKPAVPYLILHMKQAVKYISYTYIIYITGIICII